VSENPLIVALHEQRDAKQKELDGLLAAPTAEKRNLTDDESSKFDALVAEIDGFDKRTAELAELDKRKATAAEARKAVGVEVVNEPNPVYRKADGHGPSFFKDMAALHLNDRTIAGANAGSVDEIRRRLASAQETRANDMTSVAGAGGEFAPPAWLVEDFIKLARAGRVTANLLNSQVLPRGISSINLPAVSTGATAAVQATQGTAVSDTAMTTTSVSSGITTIAGKQIVSRQLIDQSGIPFDTVILGDLAADYAKKLDVAVLAGTNASGDLKGLDSAAGNAVTFTTTQPLVVSTTNAQSFYFQVISAINKVQTNRFMSPSAILMHPRRWNWVLTALDSQNRPLVTPNTIAFNGLADATSGAPTEGQVGNLLGVPVYVDANVSTAANSSTNQDEVYVLRTSDSWLYETAVESASFDATYADQASILFRILGYAALLHRYSKSISTIKGTGLVDPGL